MESSSQGGRNINSSAILACSAGDKVGNSQRKALSKEVHMLAAGSQASMH
jgi:hypothetical protein